MITVENRVGRLVEARFEGHLTVAELKQFGADLAHLIVLAGGTLVFVVDWRTCEVIDAEMEAKLIGQARSDNFAIERSAFLVAPGRPAAAQVEKVGTLGRNPSRHVLSSVAAVLEWVGPALTPEERDRVTAFFAERKVEGTG